MNGNEGAEMELTQTLKSFITLTVDQNKTVTDLIVGISRETNERLDGLSNVVEKIANAQIRSDERHAQYDDRFERLEGNQISQGAQLKLLNDTQIEMNGTILVHDKRWGNLGKFGLGVGISVVAGMIFALIKLIN